MATLVIRQHSAINGEQAESYIPSPVQSPKGISSPVQVPKITAKMERSFSLETKSFKPPTSRQPMRVSFTTSSSHDRGDVNPIHPATYLQLSYSFGDSGVEIFSPDFILPRDVDVDNLSEEDDDDSDATGCDVYSFTVARQDMPQPRVALDDSGDAKVTLHAWKQHKLLDSHVVGVVEGLGFHDEDEKPGRELNTRRRSLRKR